MTSLWVPGCGSSGVALSVSLITDFVPGVELAAVRIDIEGREPEGVEPFFSTRLSFVPSAEDDFVRGVEVARLALPRHGSYTVSVSLLDRSGAVLARRDLPIMVEVNSFSTTVLVTRSCVGVSCPGATDAEGETVCLGGRCVTPACAAMDEACPDATCVRDSDCESPVACGVGACVRGACLVAPRPEGTPGACSFGEVCDPTVGCVPAIPPSCDDGSERRCELVDGVCAGGSVRCERGFFPECGSDEYGVRYQPDESLCDGLDNDCDGETDEMGAPLCPLQSGVCAASTRICAGSDGYLACDYAGFAFEYEAVEQTCDGLDNDCDGLIDEARLSALCPLQDGVCARSRATCIDGTLVCDDAAYGPAYEVDETLCDGLDNDCDRAVDEALAGPPCALTVGVCTSSTARCRGAAGWSSCGVAEYGSGHEPTETRCDGLDNDCDGAVDEDLTRACDLGCGPGIETCAGGVFAGCTAPTRTTLRDVTLAGGAYAWDCFDVPLNASVRFGEGTRITVARDVRIEGTVTFDGRGARLVAESARIGGRGRVVAGDLTVEVTGELRIDEGGLLDGIGRYSGGGGGACTALSSAGISGGGGGGASGGGGGRGGGCASTSGLPGGDGVGAGRDGAAGCDCACSAVAAGASATGGDGTVGCAGAGGGGGAGGRGGAGGAGAYPAASWAGEGGGGGAAAQTGGRPSDGGGGGGAGGSEIGYLGWAGCSSRGGGGGAVFVLRADRLVNYGRIGVDGADGAGAAAWVRSGASGGGGAGAVIIEAALFDNVGIVTAGGGRGGSPTQHAESQGCLDTSAGGGGGGGGGYVFLGVDALGAGSLGRISVAGGAGGTVVCSSPPGEAGAAGRSCCATAIAGCPACPP